MTMNQVIISLVIASIFTWFGCATIQAADFSATFHSQYTITSTNYVSVEHTLTITNLSDIRYPTSFDLLILSNTMHDLSVFGPGGIKLSPSVTPHARGTNVSFAFPSPIVGKGKSQTVRIQYQDPGLLLASDHPRQILIPPITLSDSTASMSAQISLPESSCQSPTTTPKAQTTTSEKGILSLEYSSLSPTTSLAVKCGDIRYIHANLNYVLENSNMTPIETQVTLPPDTPYQRFSFLTIDPQPINMITDSDGNPIATFRLEPKEERQITVQAQGILFSSPQIASYAAMIQKNYLSSQPHWPISDGIVKKIISEYKTPSQILQYVGQIEHDSILDTQSVRLGGKGVNSKKPLSGQDVVDAFITLTRGAGIMSRRLIGYSIAPSSMLYPNTVLQGKLHVWADYYNQDEHTWVAVDPVWNSTTNTQNFSPISDMSHIVLAINGSSDTAPYPAGYYFTNQHPAPLIMVTNTDSFSFTPPSISATIHRSWLKNPQLIVKNTGTTALYNQTVSVTIDGHTQETTIDRFPLGNQVIIPISIPNRYETLSLTLNHQNITINQSSLNIIPQLTLTSIVVSIAGLIAVISRRLLVSRRHR